MQARHARSPRSGRAGGGKDRGEECDALRKRLKDTNKFAEVARAARALASAGCTLGEEEVGEARRSLEEPLLSGKMRSAHSAAQAVHALARLGLTPSVDAASAAVQLVSGSGSAFALSQTLWALSKTGHDASLSVAERDLLPEIVHLRHHTKDIDASTCAHACSRMRSRSSANAIAHMCERILTLRQSPDHTCSLQAMSNAVWAAGRAESSSACHSCEHLCHSLAKSRSPGAKPMELSSAAWGAARVGCSSHAVSNLCAAIASHVHSDDQNEVATSPDFAKAVAVACAACGIRRCRNGALTLSPAVSRSCHFMEPEDLANCAWGLAQALKLPADMYELSALNDKLAEALYDATPYLGPNAATNAAFAACELNLEHRDIVSVLSAASVQADTLSGDQASSCLRTCVQLDEEIDASIISAFISRLSELVALSSGSAENTAQSLASLGCLPWLVKPSDLDDFAQHLDRRLSAGETVSVNLLAEAFTRCAELLSHSAADLLICTLLQHIHLAEPRDAVSILAGLVCLRWRNTRASFLADSAARLIRENSTQLDANEIGLFIECAGALGVDLGDSDVEGNISAPISNSTIFGT